MAEIIVVTSGKGGVGKSTICAMVGAALARRDKRVLLLEMDSGLRGLDIMLGLSDRAVFDLADVLMGRCEPIKAILPCPYEQNLHLIPAPFDPEFLPDREDLIRLTRGLSKYYDYLLIDTPAGMGATFGVCIRVADRALLVATPDPICVRDGARTADQLLSRGIENLRLIINRVGVRAPRGGRVIPDLDDVIDGIGVQLIGVVPYEEQLIRATATGSALDRRLLAARACDNIAARICGTYVDLALQ